MSPTYLLFLKQCAAVSTQWEFSKVPPHLWYLRLSTYEKAWRLTIQGQDPSAAGRPPTMRMPPCGLCLNRNPQGPLGGDQGHSSSQERHSLSWHLHSRATVGMGLAEVGKSWGA